jgi:hypothetical protein
MVQGGVDLDPLVSAKDARKPLLSKLLAVPEYRTRYLQNVRDVAEQWLDWKQLQPLVSRYAGLIDREVAADTRKLSTYEEYQAGLGLTSTAKKPAGGERGLLEELCHAAEGVPAGQCGDQEAAALIGMRSLWLDL